MATPEWEAWEAYTVGNRKEIGVSYLFVGQEKLNGTVDGKNSREYVSAIMGDGNHFIFRPGHPAYNYDEIKAKAAEINPDNK